MKESGEKGLWREIKRRRVPRVVVVYVVAAWALIEASSVVFPELMLPDWSVRLVVVLAIVGFPLALVLAWAFQVTPSGLVRDRAEATGPEEGDANEAAAVQSPDESLQSVAVLPLVNMSGDPDNEYFSDGIAEEILNLLARLPGLRVASRTSSFCFKGKDLDIPTIARQLKVKNVLEGSVRRVGDRVRITAQLIDAQTDDHRWSETYDRELEDIFAVQSEIAGMIVEALHPEEVRLIRQDSATGSVTAYDYYLRGRQNLHEYDRGHIYLARQMFEKAIETDPDYALAYAGLADCCSLINMWFDRSPETLETADSASRRALELAPDQAEAHASRGFALSLAGDFAGAEREFEQAVRIDPRLYEAWYLYGRARFAQGMLEEAAQLWKKALEIRPEDFQAPCLAETAYRALGDKEREREIAWIGIENAERHLKLRPDDTRAWTLGGGTLISMGEIEKGLSWVDRALDIDPEDISVLHNVACAYAQASQADKAMDLMERRLEKGVMYRDWIEHDPDFDDLRDNPRFKELLERMS